MTFNPRRHLARAARTDATCAGPDSSGPSEREQREASSRAIHETSVQMLTRMAEALEGKNARAREALLQAAQRAEHSS